MRLLSVKELFLINAIPHSISLLFIVFCIYTSSYAQNKYDKLLKKVDVYYNTGAYSKATKTLGKLKKKTTTKFGKQNTYLPAYYIREAKINLATGLLNNLETSYSSALSYSATLYGENSLAHLTTQVEVAELFNEYGNYRKARELIEKIIKQSETNSFTDDALKAKIILIRAEALVGQGFCKNALLILNDAEDFFLSRAIEKEQFADGDKIVKKRIPEEELPVRFGNYAKLITLRAYAYSKMGELNQADSAFLSARSWIDKKNRYIGEASLALVYNNHLHSQMLSENGLVNFDETERELGFDNVLSALKRKTKATTSLTHDIYQSYLEQLQKDESATRYANNKFEYEKILNKNFSKTSVHHINFKAIGFDGKLNQNRMRNLEKDALQALASPTLPKHYKTRIRILEFLTDFSVQENLYSTIEGYLQQVLDIKKELYGDLSPEYHLTKLRLAAFYLDYTNRIDDAATIYETSYSKIVADEIGAWHKDHLSILNHLATLYEFKDQYDLASSTLDRASDVARSKYDDQDPDYAIELDKIATLQLKIGLYEKAETNITKSLKIFSEHKKEKDRIEQHIHAIGTQAKLYGLKGMFDEAQENLEHIEKIIKRNHVETDSELSIAEELSSLFIQLGKYTKTMVLLEELITQYQKLYGTNSLRLIDPLTNKAKILLINGDYTETERIAHQVNSMAVKIYGEVSTKTAPTQKLLSDLYYTLGDYEKAEEQIIKALTSQEKQFGRNHIESAKSISQLALIKFYKGDNRKDVERLMLESRDIMAGKLGKENPQYAEILKNVAVVYISEKRFDIAFSSLTTAENIWKTKAGRKNNINLAGIYTLTGDVYYQQKNYTKAQEFYIKAENLYEKFFSTSHPEYVKVQSKLAKVYYMQKDYKRAKRLIETSLNNYEGFIKQYFPALSEREKAKYWNTIKGDFEFYNTLAFSQLEDFPDLTGKVYNYQLLTKALLLNSSIKVRERIMNSTDDVLKALYNEWLSKKETLTLALSMTQQQLTDNNIDRTLLEQQIEALEKELSQRSEAFGQGFETKRIVFEDVKKSLNSTEVAVEMVRFRYFDHTFTDSVVYAVLYLKSDYKNPRALTLKDGKNMETRFFKYYRNAITGKIQDNISYNIFWGPIQKEIGQVSTVFLSADGIYNQINLESIPTPDGRYVIDNSNIVLVSNTKDIYLNKIKSKSKNPENIASMFGNPTFYLASSDNRNISSLPGTEKEVSQLQLLLSQKGWVTQQYVESNANEESIKGLNSPKIFHIATHGFYRPTEEVTLEKELEGNEAILNQNPLLRTGLLLKGAGDLLDKTKYNYNIENGILTAYEAMNLNLDKTDLVVLSACETGLGDLQAGEGVYGLQRAFLVAGAKVLIMSMFKVDDEATQKLMLKFYQKWLTSNDIRQSFTNAKKELRDEYPEPIYWGAFMMIGME